MSGAATLRAAIGSLVFAVLAPGLAAGLVPYLLTGWEPSSAASPWDELRLLGAIPIAAGVLALASSFARFVGEGTGTPAPIAPTEQVVVGGLYRWVRNPMYLAVTATILGQALLFLSPVLLGYAALFGAVVVAFVRLYEEPTLQRQFGSGYERYRESVPGWWPRRPR
jgi:protein-S-isoprenylcysteine O-methyltransferase Ste14